MWHWHYIEGTGKMSEEFVINLFISANFWSLDAVVIHVKEKEFELPDLIDSAREYIIETYAGREERRKYDFFLSFRSPDKYRVFERIWRWWRKRGLIKVDPATRRERVSPYRPAPKKIGSMTKRRESLTSHKRK